MNKSIIYKTSIFVSVIVLLSILGFISPKQAAMRQSWRNCFWVGVERAGISSHQPGRAWCPPASFLVAFDLDGDTRYSPHDAPLVGQAMCANLAGTPPGRWGRCYWVDVGRAGINSHQPVGPWCPQGTFLVAFDLDGDRRYSPYDAPIVGQAMCCSLP